ncbi:TfuA-like protein [Allomesorhizobium camelthorni]|uniref:TfuA-like protein n=1 Tax=Allomesorhizobium camelthorni TaxID=475069 RepID=UPI0031B63AA1
MWAVQHFDPAAILLIDGSFQTEPAVRHKEILWALSLGIPVIGAASMGALRAAELFPHMQGVGLVYRWYRRFAFARDDAVAVLHGPAELNFAPLTQAMIDLRMTVRSAYRQRLLSANLRASLDRAANRLNFRDRTLVRVVDDALREGHEFFAKECRAILASVFVQQKKKDAIDALRLLQREDFRRQPELASLTLTAVFTRDLEDAGLSL